jgi:hypothetical protein
LVDNVKVTKKLSVVQSLAAKYAFDGLDRAKGIATAQFNEVLLDAGITGVDAAMVNVGDAPDGTVVVGYEIPDAEDYSNVQIPQGD